ncbi:hypothetical protein V8E53_002107 [Lactarius tabidus]
MFKLGPLPIAADVVPPNGNSSCDPPPPALGPTSNPQFVTQNGTTSLNVAPCNLRLEQAQAVLAKKRKPNNNVPSALTKKQKVMADALAIPFKLNTIKPPQKKAKAISKSVANPMPVN